MQNLQKQSNFILWIFVIVALLGFFDAAFLAITHYVNGTLPCLTSGNCDLVTSSTYSKIAGIPVSLLGVFYYLATTIAMILYIDKKKPLFLKAALSFVGIGFLFTLWFVYVQLFILHAVCLYCMGSALSTTILFIVGLMLWRKARNTTIINGQQI